MQNNIKQNKLTYSELRNKIHNILLEFFDREQECSKENEFDFEWMEFKTDNILQLIKQQGGNYAE